RGQKVNTFKAASAVRGRVAFSPDGQSVAAGGEAGTIETWEVTSGKQARHWREHSGAVRGLAFSPNGKLLASAGHEGKGIVAEHSSGKVVATLATAATVYDLAWSTDGQAVVAVTAAPDAAVHRWEIASRRETVWRGHTDHVFAVAFQPTTTALASAGKDG